MSDATREPSKGPDVSKVPHVGGAAPKVEPKIEPRIEPRIEPKTEPRVEPRLGAAKPAAAAPKPSEQQFTHSLAGLSKSLGERSALHPDPVAEAAARRTAVLAQIRAEDRRLKLVLGIAGAAVAVVCVVAAIVLVAAPFGPRAAAPAVEAKAQPLTVDPPPPAPSPSPPVQTAAIEPAPPAAPLTVSPPVSSAPVSSAPPPAPSPGPLAREDVREIQARLASFGFNAGPPDGNAGRRTESAIMNYQQKRGLPQTGKPDRALLDRLRDDPSPQEPRRTQPAPPAPPRTVIAGPQRRSDGLDFVRDADARISHWLQSLSN